MGPIGQSSLLSLLKPDMGSNTHTRTQALQKRTPARKVAARTEFGGILKMLLMDLALLGPRRASAPALCSRC